MFEKFNFKSTVREGVDTENMDYKNLSEFCGSKVTVDGFFFNNSGEYGEQVVVVGNGYLINMPTRCVETFHEIADNEKMLKAVLNGKLALVNIRTCHAKAGETVIFDYKDI